MKWEDAKFFADIPKSLEQVSANYGKIQPDVLQGKNYFLLFQMVKKVQRIIFHDVWKWNQIQVSVSTNKVLLETQPCSRIYVLGLLSHDCGRAEYLYNQCWACKAENIYHRALCRKCLLTPALLPGWPLCPHAPLCPLGNLNVVGNFLSFWVDFLLPYLRILRWRKGSIEGWSWQVVILGIYFFVT